MRAICASRQWRRGACRSDHNTSSAGLSVTGKDRRRPTKQNSALSSHVHTSKVRKTSFRLWPFRSRRVAKPVSKPSALQTRTKRHTNKMKEKPSCRRRHEMFETVPSLQARFHTWKRTSASERRLLPFFVSLLSPRPCSFVTARPRREKGFPC